ncbi:GspH/FimT family pseudopilin [Hyphomonas sp.]|uniref:GspH/FimT family pseudopilin n=1 Tax=Hyphomonas sp. TaxID=87 RepID=UPI00391B28D6
MAGAGHPFRREAGYSLMELLVALTILALAMGVVSLSVSRRSPAFEMRRTASETVSLVREARLTAQSTGRAARIVFDAEARRITGPGEASVTVPEGIETSLVSSASAGPSAIIFFPDGSSTGGKLTLEILGRRETVTVDWLTSQVEREVAG